MNRVLKFNTKTQNIWFSGCIHAYHKLEPLLKSRNVKTAEEHTINNLNVINKLIKPNDIFFVLGDWFLNATEDLVEEYWSKIKCQNNFYIFGNHFSVPWKIYKRELLKAGYQEGLEVYPFKYKNITFVGNYLEIIVNKQGIVLSHYPISSWNHQAHGSLNLVSHSHGSYLGSQKNNLIGKQLDVGIDSIGRPHNFQEIMEIMKFKSVSTVDHHSGPGANIDSRNEN